eukprot:403348238
MDFSSVNMGELGRQIFARLLKVTSSEGAFDDILYECQQSNQPYVDEQFPAANESLIKNWKDPLVQDKVSTWKQFKWLRPHEIPVIQEGGVELAVFLDSIDPSDIRQGLLGDCYFLSCLSVLAENPKRIMKLFVTDKVNDYGVYAIRICKNGEWKEVVIDDRIPCFQGEPAFSKSVGDELWVLLMEKAWAKLHNSYERIEAGFAEQVLRDLTGAPCEVVHSDDQEVLWQKLMEAETKGYLIAASAGTTNAAKELLEKLGLIGNHSYGVLDVREIKLENGMQERLIKIRNPWGDFEWNGDWGDDSELWTPKLEKLLGQSDGNDGIFFMNLDDFCHYFSRVQICRINDNFKYSSFKYERCFDRSDDYDYSNAKFILSKIISEEEGKLELEYMGGSMGQSRDNWKEYQKLKKGEYYVYAEIDWIDKVDITEFTLSAYGTGQAYFIRDDKMLYKKQDILAQIYLSCGLQELPGCKHTNYEQYQESEIHKYTQICEEGFGFVVYNNLSQDSTLTETITYSKFDGLELMKPYKGQSYDVLVGPKEKKIVLIRQVDPYGYSMSSSTSSSIQFSTEKLKRLCKEEGKLTKRVNPQNKQELEIYQYQFKHSSGICYLYENKTPNKRFEEQLKFVLSGLEIVEKSADGSDTVKIKLGPGESKFIELKSIGPQWKIQTAVSFGVY